MKNLALVPVATVLILIYALVGAEQVVGNHLLFSVYLKDMAIACAGLAIGRGLDADHKP